MNKMMLLRALSVLLALVVLTVVMTRSAAAETDVYLGVAFHPFTLDEDNSTCVDYVDGDIGPTRNCDPVNLVFPGRTWTQARDLLLDASWSLSGGGSSQWLHYDEAQLHVEDEQLYKPGTLFGPRYHIRLWQATGDILVTFAAVHHEDFFHNIDMSWEQAEGHVASALCGSECQQTGLLAVQSAIQSGDGEWRGWANDGSATVIPGPATPTPTATPTSTPTPTPVMPTNTPTPTPVTPTNTPTPTPVTPTNTPTPTPVTPTNTPTPTPVTPTNTPTSTPVTPTNTPTPTPVTPTNTPTSTPVTPTNTPTPTPVTPTTTPTPTPTETPAAETVHVGDLSGVRVSVRKNWQAEVTILVHDASETAVVGATVFGNWSDDPLNEGDGSCTTDGSGSCPVSSKLVSKKTEMVIFSVTDIDYASLTYSATDNHDPQGDSSGSAIQVNKDGTTQDPGVQPNQPPDASFSYGCQDLFCSFDGSGSADADGSIVSYAWDFGDGRSGSGSTASHTYTSAGTYTVQLTVTDDDGDWASVEQSVAAGQVGEELTLTASSGKVRGVYQVILSWSGANLGGVDIKRDSSIIASETGAEGSYTDIIGKKTAGPYVYVVCEAGGTTCSNEVVVTF